MHHFLPKQVNWFETELSLYIFSPKSVYWKRTEMSDCPLNKIQAKLFHLVRIPDDKEIVSQYVQFHLFPFRCNKYEDLVLFSRSFGNHNQSLPKMPFRVPSSIIKRTHSHGHTERHMTGQPESCLCLKT